ncbi:MAG: hypothetical protein ACE5GJ_05895 [Gemmatimonadota bacterium]
MLKWLRGKRFDLKTTIIVVVVALIAWAFVIYANIVNFVPEELTRPDSVRGPSLP